MTKKCTRCHIEKPIGSFSINKRYSQVPGSKSHGRNSMCQDCFKVERRSYYTANKIAIKAKSKAWRSSNPERYREYMKARHAANKPRFKDKILKRVYGISLNEYNEMLREQGFRCACCLSKDAGYKSGSFGVDHCHKSGLVRKLLCRRCNFAVGLLEDDPHLALSVANYLFDHGHGLELQQ